jgi:hypothetical protein
MYISAPYRGGKLRSISRKIPSLCLVVHAGSSSGEYGWWEPSATTTQPEQQEVPAPAHTTTPPSGPLSSSSPSLRSSFLLFCPPPTVGAAGPDLGRLLPHAHPNCLVLVSLLNACQGRREGGGGLFVQGGENTGRLVVVPAATNLKEWAVNTCFFLYMLTQHRTTFNLTFHL